MEQVAIGTNEAGALAGSAAPVDPTYFHSDVTSDLGGFLSRPIKILEETWTKDTPLFFKIDPWTRFITNEQVLNKLQGFGAIRGNLHIKFTIAGSPFFSGYAMISYNPLADFDLQRDLPVNTQYAPIRESQRICTTLDPTLSKGGELVCPFYWPYDAVGLTNTPDYSYLGRLTIRDIARLRSVSDTSTSCTIAAYAWMEDVAMIGQTSLEVVVPTVAHMAEADKPGPVSKVATAISDKAGALTGVPGIGSYAAATQVAAQGIATAAKAFGLSRPTDQSDITKIKVFDSIPLATTNQAIPDYVLATDARNEMTIDPRVAGFPDVDELDIQHLTERESFLGSGTLQLSDTPGTVLFSSGVTPLLFSEDTGNNCEHHTPMSYIAQMFSKWRGNIKYRFVFHTSAFHKAKVRIIHDHTDINLASTDRSKLNMAEHYIADISEEREFTICVGWCRQEQFRFVHGSDRTERWQSNALHTSQPINEFNGNITMVLENAMTAPYNVDPSDAEVQFSVFVCADNLQLATPAEDFTAAAKFLPGEPTPPAKATQQPKKKKGGPKSTIAHARVDPTSVSAPEESCSPTHTFGKLVDSSGPQSLIFIGERVVSLRSLLKRFSTYTHLSYNPPTPYWHKIWHRNYPTPRGVQDPHVPWRAMTIINYVGQMFLARRGGVRWHLSHDNDTLFTVEAVHPINRISESQAWAINPDDDFARMGTYLKILDNGHSGQQQFRRNGSVMIPGSSLERFLPSRSDSLFSARSETGFSVVSKSVPGDPVELSIYAAGAEDLTYHGFMGTPIVFRGTYI